MSEPTKSEVKNALSYLEQFNVDCSSLTSKQVVDLESETKGQVSFLERHGANLEGKSIEDIKNTYGMLQSAVQTGKREAAADLNEVTARRERAANVVQSLSDNVHDVIEAIDKADIVAMYSQYPNSKRLLKDRKIANDDGSVLTIGCQIVFGMKPPEDK